MKEFVVLLVSARADAPVVMMNRSRAVGQRVTSWPKESRSATAWQSIGTLLLAKRARAHHIDALADDTGLAFAL